MVTDGFFGGIMNWGVSDAIALFVVNLNVNVSPALAYSGFGLVLLNDVEGVILII